MEQTTSTKLERLTTENFYHKLMLSEGCAPIKMTDEDWTRLGKCIDDIYDHFTCRLLAIARLSGRELKICYMVKLNVPPVNMSSLLYVSKAAITLARRRLHKKLTGKEGTASQFDELIRNF
ncbi:MAG: hypothetical protein IJ176_02570 [Prevotella sp.]|nr:hypothetical protein [Prevotella sp.]